MSLNEAPHPTPPSTIRTRSQARLDEQLGGARTLRSSSKPRGQDSSDAESSPSGVSPRKTRKRRAPGKPNGTEVSSSPKKSYPSSTESNFYVLVPPRTLFSTRTTTLGNLRSLSSDESYDESKLGSSQSPCKPLDQAIAPRSTSSTIALRAPVFLAFTLILAAIWRAYGEDLWRTYGHYFSY